MDLLNATYSAAGRGGGQEAQGRGLAGARARGDDHVFTGRERPQRRVLFHGGLHRDSPAFPGRRSVPQRGDNH